MNQLVSFSLAVLFSTVCYTQEPKTNFLKKKIQIEKRSMTILAGWAGLNIISGSIGWATTKNESKYFNQMNVAWNVVNLGVSLPSLLRKHPENLSNQEIMRQQHTIEKVLLLNTGLDVAYITGGFLLKEMSKNNPDNYHRYQGFGNSLLLQGGFLFAFDIIQFIIHQQHRKKGFQDLSSGLSISKQGIGLCYNF